MSRDNILYALVGVGFGLFFGFLFVAWANQRAAGPEAVQAGAGAAGAAQQSSITVNDPAQMQRAVADMSQQARAKPQDFDAQMLAGRANYQAQRYDDALEFFTKASQLRPDDVETTIQLGNVNYDAGHFEAAEKFYTAALVKEPENVNVRTDLGLTFMLRTPPQYDRAIGEFNRSLERDARHEQTLQNLVVAYTRKGDKAQAQAMLKRLEAINPNNPSLAQLRADLQ
ncbi:MAG TPA: tetratricopeptide repeat protein [Pyrinomonadaceae bacterium]|jgi:tetratricopeptide (TPR) repeat protein